MTALSPIAAKQRALYGMDSGIVMLPGAVRRAIRMRAGSRLGYFGLAENKSAGSSVYSGPPVGQGSGKGAATGAVQGASVGAVAGPIGMAIGAAIGAIGGAIAGALGKRDPEQANFDQAVAIYNQNPAGILALNNKYLPLAGLFDLNIRTNIPIYRKYGRMGEEKFLTDMVMQIYNAAQSGKITASDTPQTIMVKVVQPWIDSWGFGPMSDPHQDMINMLLMGLIIDYVTGNQKNWLARGGQWPFGRLPAFSFPAVQSVATGAPQPSLVASTQAPTVMSAQPEAPLVIGTILTTDGSVITPGSNTSLQAQGHTFTFGTAPLPGGYAVYIDSQWDHTGGGIAVGLLNGQVYLQNKQGDWYQWTPSGWTGTQKPTAQTSTSQPSGTTVPIPIGFSVVSTDSATGLPVYTSISGGYFSWTGTNMTPYTGTLVSGLTVSGGNLVSPAAQAPANMPSLNTGSQQLFNSSSAPPADIPSASQPALAPQPAALGAPVSTATTAGLSGLPSWVSWGAVAATAALLFATARPIGRPRPRARSRKSR